MLATQAPLRLDSAAAMKGLCCAGAVFLDTDEIHCVDDAGGHAILRIERGRSYRIEPTTLLYCCPSESARVAPASEAHE